MDLAVGKEGFYYFKVDPSEYLKEWKSHTKPRVSGPKLRNKTAPLSNRYFEIIRQGRTTGKDYKAYKNI